MNNDLILYTNPRSRGQIALWLMEESGLKFKTEVVEFGSDFHLSGYRKINPMGKVPTLVHGDKVITEAAAICAYIADVFPETNLKPDQQNLADFYRWLFFASGPLEQAVTNNSLKIEIPKEREGMVGYGSFDKVIANLKINLKDKKYVAGNKFSAADVYVGAQIGWGLMFGTIPAEPEFVAYWNGLKDRPACSRSFNSNK